MSDSDRMRELAREMTSTIRSVERRKVRTANAAERKVLDLLAAESASEQVGTAACFGPTRERKRIDRVESEARRAVRDAVREIAGGPHAADVHPVITAFGLALGLTELVTYGNRQMWDAAIELQCAAHDRLRTWARTVEREGGVADAH